MKFYRFLWRTRLHFSLFQLSLHYKKWIHTHTHRQPMYYDCAIVESFVHCWTYCIVYAIWFGMLRANIPLCVSIINHFILYYVIIISFFSSHFVLFCFNSFGLVSFHFIHTFQPQFIFCLTLIHMNFPSRFHFNCTFFILNGIYGHNFVGHSFFFV